MLHEPDRVLEQWKRSKSSNQPISEWPALSRFAETGRTWKELLPEHAAARSAEPDSDLDLFHGLFAYLDRVLPALGTDGVRRML